MKFPNRRKIAAALLTPIAALLLWATSLGVHQTQAQSAVSHSAATGAKEVPIDEYDRTAQFWYYQRMGRSGWERGQEIYYMKCWMCHNDYTRKAEPNPANAAPTLRNLFKRRVLMSGQPVNDQTVTAQIRNGSPRMPAYSPVLNDKDLSDLVTYLREKCCWDEMHPPANPRYRAQ